MAIFLTPTMILKPWLCSKGTFFKYLQKVKINGINLGVCKLGFNLTDNVSNDDQFIVSL